tara:strand:- start:2273 stop:2458 length:186 start_codon:yes stop_codon:yes gene_type:complete
MQHPRTTTTLPDPCQLSVAALWIEEVFFSETEDRRVARCECGIRDSIYMMGSIKCEIEISL